MTDTEVKTPNKRKSPFANKNSAKKSQENEGSPAKKSKGQFPQNTPQNKKTANLQNNSTKKQNTPKGQNVQNGNPDSAKKKVKPFAGTGNMQTPKGKAGKGINQTPESKVKAEGKPNKQSPKGIPNKAASNEGKDGVKRKRNTAFKLIKQKMVEGDKSVLKSIEEKIQAIQSRGDDLSKTAKRKLKILNRLKRKIEGEATPGQQVNQNQKKVKEGNKPNQKAKKQQQVKNEPPKKKQKVMIEEEESDGDDSDEDDDDEVESGEEVEEESSGEEASEEEGSEEEEEDEDEDDDESDDESEEEEAPLSKEKDQAKRGTTILKSDKNESTGKTKLKAELKIEDLKKKNLMPPMQSVKHKTRYVVFVGNIPYETKKEEIKEHFQSCGEILHIRIPTEKKTNKPRGFCYVEVANEESYQKCLSKHHTFVKGRRINVLYTHGGKKKADEIKKVVKAKNMKLQALRREGMLVGSKKENQKRSFRRKKQHHQTDIVE